MSKFTKNTITQVVRTRSFTNRRDLSIVSTSVRENSILFSSLVTAVGSIWGRIGYWLFRLLWLWKKLFKILAFSFSSELIEPSFSRGGIDVLDCGEMKVLRTVHQSLAEIFPLVNFEAILSWKAFLASRISETVLFLKVLNCVQCNSVFVGLSFR